MKRNISLLLPLCLLLLTRAFAADNSELDKLQGKWECKKTDENGQKLTLTMEFKKDKLTFKIDGGISIVATADVKLEKLGPFKTLTSRNIKYGSSEDSLQESDEQFAHVYQIDGDSLYMTSNFDKERDRPPGLDIYRRVSSTGGK
jgi:uncharacterized protein (TIGR03067 family)